MPSRRRSLKLQKARNGAPPPIGPRHRFSGSRRRAPARASLERIGARPGERWLCCLPTFHMAGLGVLVRSLVAGAEPVVAGRLDADVLARSGCEHVSVVPTQLRRLLDCGAPLPALR